MRPRLATALSLALLLLAAGCGGGGGDAIEDIATLPGGAEGEPGETPGPFQSVEFDPPISFQVPAGWRVGEEFGVIQGIRGATERWALTIESAPDGGDAAANVEEIRGTPELEAQEPQPATVAGHEGFTFEAESTGDAPVLGSEYFVVRHSILRVWVIDVDGTLVRVFAEAGTLRKEDRDTETDAAFFNEVQQILDSMEFGSAPAAP